MSMSDARLKGFLSGTVVRIRHINYVEPGGVRIVNEGPVEITLDSDTVFRLESGADGESLRFKIGEWVDPFAEPLSPANREFVAKSGKWSAFDVSDDRGFCKIVGDRLRDLDLITFSEKIVGVELIFGTATLKAQVCADELLVEVRDNDVL